MPIHPVGPLTPVVHPSAFVHAGAWVLGDVHLGEESSAWPTAVLRGDAGRISIGARTNLQDGAIAHATTGVSTTTIGVECTVGHRVILHGCTVGNRCLIGMGAVVMDNVVLGDECFVAAGTLIPPGKVFEPRSFILGSPGKRLRAVGPEELELIARGWKGYVELAKRHRA
jgi:carbonic anhydrase/acetyltransferase-like protein (isoleucine patch superfamily)